MRMRVHWYIMEGARLHYLGGDAHIQEIENGQGGSQAWRWGRAAGTAAGRYAVPPATISLILSGITVLLTGPPSAGVAVR
jgi:hypothetical protein